MLSGDVTSADTDSGKEEIPLVPVTRSTKDIRFVLSTNQRQF